MNDDPLTIEQWESSHPRWAELANAIHAEGQDWYWQEPAYWSQFPHVFLVALQRGEIVGYLEFFRQPIGPDRDCPPLYLHGERLEEAKILAFAVIEKYRRHGIGRALQRKAIERARDLGCFQLRSYSSNEPAHRANYQLKLSMGFAAQPEYRGPDNAGVNFIMPLRPVSAR